MRKKIARRNPAATALEKLRPKVVPHKHKRIPRKAKHKQSHDGVTTPNGR